MLRKLAYAAPAAVMAVSLTGCMGIGDNGGKGTPGNDGNGVALSAAQVVNKAASKTASVDSYKMSMRMTMAGKMGGRQQAMHMSGTGAYQLKPTLGFAMSFNTLHMGGQSLPGGIQMRLVNRTIYMKMAALQKMTGGKPWLKFSTAQLSKRSGLNFDQYLSQAKDQANPQTYTKMFTSSADVKKVGQQTVRGVQTTHYTGTVDLTKALDKVDVKNRKGVADQLKQLKKAKFDLFTDDQQLPRKIVLHGSGAGMSYSTTMYYTDFGQPVHVAAPPAGETADGAKLGNGMPH
jgi:hypothetical protein